MEENNTNEKKIAIVGPGVLPIPDVRGGAIEKLVTGIMDVNDNIERYQISIHTVYDKELESIHYKKTDIISVKR